MSLNTIINSREKYIQDTIADFDKVWSKLVPGLQKDILRLFRNGDYSKESILAAFEGNGFNEMAQEFVGRYSEMVKYSKDITGELGYKFLLTQDNISLFETLMDVQVDKLTDKQQIINDMRRFAVESEIEGRTVANIRTGLDRIFVDMGRRLNTEIYTGIRTFGAGVDLKNFTNSGIQKFVYSGPVDNKTRTDPCLNTMQHPKNQTGFTLQEIYELSGRGEIASFIPDSKRWNCRHRWLPFVG